MAEEATSDVGAHRDAPSPTLSDHAAARAVQERFGDAVQGVIVFRDETTIRVTNAAAHDVLQFLRDDPAHAYDMLIDMTAVDWRVRRPRFDVVYQLYSTRNRDRLRIKSGVNAIESGDSIPTSADLWSAGNWLERECYDMFGINFAGHPDLRRILLPEDWNEGYPLRKDYPLRGHKQWGQYH